MRHFLATTLALSALAACGGSGSGPTVVTVPADISRFGDDDVLVELTPSGDIITVTKSGGPVALGTGATPDIGAFKTASSTSGDYTIAFISQSDASVAAGTVYDDGGAPTHGAFYARTSETNLPTEGSATMEGNYLGMLINPADGGSLFGAGVQGDLSIAVNFGTSLVSGAITNRDIVQLTTSEVVADTTAADLILVETDLEEDGSFLGTTTGGVIDLGTSISTVDGFTSFNGLIAGTDASEVVGGIFVAHDFDGDPISEVGVFAAGH